MVFLKLLAANEQGIAPFFAGQDNRDGLCWLVEAEKQPVLAKEAQFPLRDRIGAKRLHVPRILAGIFSEPLLRRLENFTAFFFTEPLEIADDGLSQCNFPSHAGSFYID